MHPHGLTTLGFVALLSQAMPTGEEHQDSTSTFNRRDCSSKFGDSATKTYGDFTGCWRQYFDGSGTCVRTADVHHYGDGTKCWTDQVAPPNDFISFYYYPAHYWRGEWDGAECLPDGGFMHTQNQSMAAGSAWAISYESDLARSLWKVWLCSLCSSSELRSCHGRKHIHDCSTPWKCIVTYEALSRLLACSLGGCSCAWLWVPNGCGQANMYMQPYKCNVTGAMSTKSLTKAKAPVMCENDVAKCIMGAKQMIAWNEQSGNNIEVASGASPAYSQKCSWKSGAQDDIFTSDED